MATPMQVPESIKSQFFPFLRRRCLHPLLDPVINVGTDRLRLVWRRLGIEVYGNKCASRRTGWDLQFSEERNKGKKIRASAGAIRPAAQLAAPPNILRSPISSSLHVVPHGHRGGLTLALARSIQPRRTSARHIALPIPKLGFQDAVENLNPPYTVSIDRPRDQDTALQYHRPQNKRSPCCEKTRLKRQLASYRGFLKAVPTTDCSLATTTATGHSFGGSDCSAIQGLSRLRRRPRHPVVLRQATDSEAATWGDEVLLAAAEFKGLQGSLEGVLEEERIGLCVGPSDRGTNDQYYAAGLWRTLFAVKGGEAHTFLLEIQQTGRLPPAAACTTAIQTLLDQLLDPTIPSEDKLTTRPQYLDWVRALPPALSHENVPFAKHLVDILFRPDISVSPLARILQSP
ncbi:hypothetical protein FA13DRAFT_1829140 [Coprinellus micaceus]|uniref:Uncharacterized protein n=1 Tax=Coprinellus micaceus TaxID=71717 RepID=A0A4Y7TJK4_COPMI|nr:hypothetical protein FA13DRAFT_1829140 [Coprinellus micaceus]